MTTDKHTYVIIGLLVVNVFLLGGLYAERNRNARDLLQNAVDNVSSCEDNIKAWKTKYAAQPGSSETKSELSSILSNCLDKIDSAKKAI